MRYVSSLTLERPGDDARGSDCLEWQCRSYQAHRGYDTSEITMNVERAFAVPVNELNLWGLAAMRGTVKIWRTDDTQTNDVIGVSPRHALLLVFSRCTSTLKPTKEY